MLTIKQQKGFTLIELVVAVAIFAVVSTITIAALMKFLDIRERITEQQEQLSQLQKTFLFLANDVRFAVNRKSKDSYGDPAKLSLLIDNQGAIAEFSTAYPELSIGGLSVPRKVVWELDDETLIRKQYPTMDPDSDTQFIKQKLLDGVESVAVTMSQIENNKSKDSKRWKEEGSLPDLFNVELKLKNQQAYQRTFQMHGLSNN